MARGNLDCLGFADGTAFEGKRATVSKAAAGRQMNGIGRVAEARYGLVASAKIHGWDGRKQGLRIGMLRIFKQALPGSYFDDTPVIHHGNPIGDIFDDRKIVGYEQQGEFKFLPQIPEQIEDLCLHGNIKRRHWLVADDQTWLQHEGTRNADALQLSAGEFVRIAEAMLRPKTDLGKNRRHGVIPLGRLQHLLNVERHANGGTNGSPWIETGLGILEYQLRKPALLLELFRRQGKQILIAEEDLARTRALQSENGPSERAFAAAGFTDKAKGFAALQRQTDAVDRIDVAGRGAEQSFAHRVSDVQCLNL